MWVDYVPMFLLCLTCCDLLLWKFRKTPSCLETTRAFTLIARIIQNGPSRYEILHVDSSCNESITVKQLFEAYPEHANSGVSVKSTFLSLDSVLVDGALINLIPK